MSRLAKLFQGYTRAYGRFVLSGQVSKAGKHQKDPKLTNTYKGSPSDDDWAAHERGDRVGLGAVPLMDDGESVMFGAIDIDVYGVDIVALERRCLEANLPLVFSHSKSEGAHLWLFCRSPLPATLVQRKLSDIAAWLGHGGCEIFPKQTSRASETDAGNWINLPYFGDTRKGLIDGQDVDRNTWIDYAEGRRASIEQVMSIRVEPEVEWFKDGPPCLQHLHKAGYVEGGRNNAMFAVGVYFKTSNPEDWERDLLEYNMKHLSEPLDSREVQGICENLVKKDYSYPCAQPPIVSFCNKAACMKRKFGIGASTSTDLDVTLGGLTKYDSRPPTWVLEVDEVRIQVETDDLMAFPKFRKICLEHLNKLPTFVKQNVWEQHVQNMLKDVLILSAPEDASPVGQFFNLLTQFIADRARSEQTEITLGNVWMNPDDNRAYFQSTDLVNILRRNSFSNFSVPRLFALLVEHKGAQEGHFTIKGRKVKYWSVLTEDQQTEDFDIPNYDKAF